MALAQTIQHSVLRVHQALYESSGGAVGHRILRVPTLLRSTGRRSGVERTNALVYAKDGTELVLVASNGGSDKPPAWLLNVRANPAVEIQIARTRSAGTARVVERGDADYERLWRLANENNHARYEAYQQQTSRPIPLVVVSPN